MRGLLLAVVVSSGCATALHSVHPLSARPPDDADVVHVLNRMTFGARAADVDRVRAMGIASYIDEQLHPERIPDAAVASRLAAAESATIPPRSFAVDYYKPMVAARQEIAAQERAGPVSVRPAYLRWRLLPIAAVSLPGGPRPPAIVQQPAVTPEEARFQYANQRAFEALQADKLLRAVYSERQLEEELTDFWFNHFNVDARKIEERPVTAAYERDVIRPHVLGRFRDLLEATAKSPAMLFYLDNWLSAASGTEVGSPGKRPPSPASRGLNENYGRELLELHTLGVDGGYTQRDVVDVARCFTGWTMTDPHDGLGFAFKPGMHDKAAKRVLGHRIKAGGGMGDGEAVLDILARHPSTARLIATKLVRRFVSDEPPQPLVDRAARTFRRTGGDLREVMRTILTSPEFFAADARRAKVKAPFEYVASALRATGSDVRDPRPFVNTIASLGEPLYQQQPPTGYPDFARTWINTGTLVARLNFAQAFAGNGLNASSSDRNRAEADLRRLLPDVEQADPSLPAPRRIALLLGSPAFQRR
ncbi:MAG TPA: DUF1800 domain-containing protein [Vicinamibacterales bacterium]|nr:DUF1800 domain-containing protein [Vicinamibacterales bacterium]